jgi:hypothetical protein
VLDYHTFGLIGTALSIKISVFQPSSLNVAPISPNASYACARVRDGARRAQTDLGQPDAVDALFASITATFGRLDHLYNKCPPPPPPPKRSPSSSSNSMGRAERYRPPPRWCQPHGTHSLYRNKCTVTPLFPALPSGGPLVKKMPSWPRS